MNRLRLPVILLVLGFASCAEKAAPKPEAAAHWVAGVDASRLDLLAVDLIDTKNGWAVGDIDPAGAGGAIYQTTDGGKSWSAAARISEVFAGVHFVSATRGWVAGYAGTISRTDDGGLTWRTQRGGSMMETRQPEREGEALNSIFFFDGDHGWAVGGSGLILRTANGGDSWELADAGRVEDLWAVRFASRDRGWIVGEDGLILASTDGGKNWQPLASGTHASLYGLAVEPPSLVIVAGGAGTIIRSEDGTNWMSIASNTTEAINSVAVAGKGVFWGVGSRGATLGSSDRGRSWTAIRPVLSRDLVSIDLVDPAHAVAVGRRGAVQLLE